jgi:hypothetical protein
MVDAGYQHARDRIEAWGEAGLLTDRLGIQP